MGGTVGGEGGGHWRARAGLGALGVAMREHLFLFNQRRRLRRVLHHRRAEADAAEVVEAVRRKVFIATISAGRSGTTYLARLLSAFPDLTSMHEPAPHYAYFMRQAQHSRDSARQFLLQYKLPCIAADPAGRYAEISHLFCKGFVEPLLELGIIPRVVFLRRAPRLVAASWLTRGVVPGRWKRGLKLHLHPGDPGVLPYPGWWRATDYQLCFWYALEIERRQRWYRQVFDGLGAPWADVTAEELHDPARFLALGERLGLITAQTDPAPLLERHRAISAVRHKPNRRRIIPAAPEEETAVWAAVRPHAPWLQDEIARRYGRAGGGRHDLHQAR